MRVLAGSELPISIKVPLPFLIRLVTVPAAVNALLLLMVSEVPPMAKVALPMIDNDQ
jgi:hypothetical protein